MKKTLLKESIIQELEKELQISNDKVQKIQKEITLKNNLICTNKKVNKIVITYATILTIVLFGGIFLYKSKMDSSQMVISGYQSDISQYKEKLDKYDSLYLFLGDSLIEFYDIFKFFPDYRVINSGKGGNTTDDILENLYTRVYRYHPTEIFLQIGTNDITANKTIEEIYQNIKKIVEDIKVELPEVNIYIESLYPSRGTWSENKGNDRRKQINQLLQEFCQQHNYTYIDMYSSLKEENSDEIKEQYVIDGLHLSDEGYEVITNELRKYMGVKSEK